ncbi:hypothetical protein PENSPDRAFT_204468 [Peniophora sp. CONT]|nr:hypothetical protein PENSPDRAFT_204468 [Peniophora sp. CONT]
MLHQVTRCSALEARAIERRVRLLLPTSMSFRGVIVVGALISAWLLARDSGTGPDPPPPPSDSQQRHSEPYPSSRCPTPSPSTAAGTERGRSSLDHQRSAESSAPHAQQARAYTDTPVFQPGHAQAAAQAMPTPPASPARLRRPQPSHYPASAQTHGSSTYPTGNQIDDATHIIALQAQVRAGKDEISALEAKMSTLSMAMERADADAARVVVLREEVRNSELIISSLDTKLDALRSQARTKDQILSSTEARVAQLSAALERAEANAARVYALWTDARGSDAIIYSLDSKLEALREQSRNKEETIASLESRIVSLSAALTKIDQRPQRRGPMSPNSGQCERCTPPVHITAGKARGMWLRRQAETLNDEAGKILFDAHNPELVGPRARLRNEMRIDLHLQYRSAAVDYVKSYATSARAQGLNKLIFIVGKGLHSEDNISKLRPLVLDALKSLGMDARSPEYNIGEIVVKLQSKVD